MQSWVIARTTPAFRVALMAAISAAAAGAVFLLPPIPQDPSYHNFADQRRLAGIANALDVLSNIPFALVGGMGLLFVCNARKALAGHRERLPYAAFFLGVLLTGAGSAFYHLAPDSGRLVWDRLPMALAFTALLAAVLTERVSLRAGPWLLAPLALLGMGSVAYWHWTELLGRGDLRPYILVQYYSLLALAMTLVLFPPRYSRAPGFAVALFLYGLAKVFELLDAPIYNLAGLASGHTLKHLTAAAAVYVLLHMLQHRKILADANPHKEQGSEP